MTRLTDNAIKVLEKRYFIKNADGSFAEDADGLFKRVATRVAAAEAPENQVAWATRFCEMMSRLDFIPNTPCLVNAGRPGSSGQLSACFVLPVEDSMEGIFGALTNMALVHKTGGGTGFSFSRLRPKDDPTGSGIGVASGPISFMQIFDYATGEIKQGGVRRGANMGVLRIDHPDVLEFIRMKLDPARMQNFNVSVAITDDFMAALASGGTYDLINPNTKLVAKTLSARYVYDEIVRCAHAIGDPGLIFIDRINALDPLSAALGPIEATNPCGEVPLRGDDACTLGSINLANFVSYDGRTTTIDYVRLADTVRTAVVFLDDVVTVNKYPLASIHDTVTSSRKIGLGVMGWADTLIQLGIPYGSSEAQALGEEVMRRINDNAVGSSELLARARGPFAHWKMSTYCKAGKPLRRNATVTVIAPTGTISIIAGCSSGIEPLYALSITRQQAGMTMTEVNPLVEMIALREGFYSSALMNHVRSTGSMANAPDVPDRWRDVFRTAGELTMEEHIKMQAAFQRHTEDAVSKTINLPNTASQADVDRAYMLAYSEGCKGITVYRDGCRSGQVLTAGVPPVVAHVESVAYTVPTTAHQVESVMRESFADALPSMQQSMTLTVAGSVEPSTQVTATVAKARNSDHTQIAAGLAGSYYDQLPATSLQDSDLLVAVAAGKSVNAVTKDDDLRKLQVLSRDLKNGEVRLSANSLEPYSLPPPAMKPWSIVGVDLASGPSTSAVTVVEMKPATIERRRIPDDGIRQGATLSRATPYGTAHVTINVHPSDNEPFEVFVSLGKSGSEVKAWTEAFGRATSYLLSIPSPISPRSRLDAIAQQLGSIGGGMSIGFGKDQTVSAPDAIAKILLAYLYPQGDATALPATTEPPARPRADICPECGQATLTFVKRCGECISCGYSKC